MPASRSQAVRQRHDAKLVNLTPMKRALLQATSQRHLTQSSGPSFKVK
jgi:hypothetical protein